jgi:hypothetical protein
LCARRCTKTRLCDRFSILEHATCPDYTIASASFIAAGPSLRADGVRWRFASHGGVRVAQDDKGARCLMRKEEGKSAEVAHLLLNARFRVGDASYSTSVLRPSIVSARRSMTKARLPIAGAHSSMCDSCLPIPNARLSMTI